MDIEPDAKESIKKRGKKRYVDDRIKATGRANAHLIIGSDGRITIFKTDNAVERVPIAQRNGFQPI
jgi:hypothetical protein